MTSVRVFTTTHPDGVIELTDDAAPAGVLDGSDVDEMEIEDDRSDGVSERVEHDEESKWARAGRSENAAPSAGGFLVEGGRDWVCASACVNMYVFNVHMCGVCVCV